ncbi:helix-turn-helix DNA-binding domain protein [Gordonia phage VanLee]|uniref:Helix-turn-helix DNA-binding domain protein n=1 Tax=Gordonia phage VanLee TaxID=2845816 RepID=A0A8F2DAA5_9CAUD|nr:helix-turn-helix DNA-binding domain protein [Gordonia phage VanLee]QWS68224.1 helix-turn-helix DNA-binding domain protein [Gordonia phage VanLee]
MSEHHYSLTNRDLGRRLQQLRMAAGMSAETLSGAASPLLDGAPEVRQGFLNRVGLARIEGARRVLKYSEAVAIAKVLDIPVTAFTSDAAADAAAEVLARRHQEAS